MNRYRALLIVLAAFGLMLVGQQSLAAPLAQSGGPGYSLRFYGQGVSAPDLDRVKIPIDPHVPADVGAGDFTLEFWMKADRADNNGSVTCNSADGWITGNILFDRDIFGAGDHGDYGIALGGGRIGFGVNNDSSGTVLCGATVVTDGAWHHVAVTRNGSTGQLRVYVDGRIDGSGDGPTGDLSYRDGRSTNYPNSDPFLVIGAEKHDVGPAYPSYRGFIDEVRISNNLRYRSKFTRPTGPFVPDAGTVALYHFDEGPAGACTGDVFDSSGAVGSPGAGVCRYGGGAAGPVYSTDTPFGAVSTPKPTRTPTVSLVGKGTPTPTRTPTRAPARTATMRSTASLASAHPTAFTSIGYGDRRGDQHSGDADMYRNPLRADIGTLAGKRKVRTGIL